MSGTGNGAVDEELAELALQAFEVFLRRCPQQCASVNGALGTIERLALAAVRYDPNYSYDDGAPSLIHYTTVHFRMRR